MLATDDVHLVLCSTGQETGTTGNPIQQAKRSRQGKPKTKTGCITCKIRRIKCDEAKPECAKCTSTGRKCDGYATPSSKPQGRESSEGQTTTSDMVVSLQIPQNPFLDFPGTELEHRYLDYFHSETAPMLSGIFDSRFWNALLPQIGRSEPTIRHAMMAVASMHEHVEAFGASMASSDRLAQIVPQNGRFTLIQYNKAIHHLNQRLSEGCQSEEVILTCCVLFICLEFLRGNVQTAISHLQSGLKILIAWRTNSPSASNMQLDHSSEPQSMADNLEQLFSRLTIQSFLSGHPTSYLHPEDSRPQMTTSIPTTFNTLHEAKSSMDHLSKMAVRFLRLATPFKYQNPPPPMESLEQSRELFKIKFDQWSSAFSSMLALPKFHMNHQEERAAMILQIQFIIARIWMGISLSKSELATDQYTEDFQAIVKLSAAIQDMVPRSNGTSSELSKSDTKVYKTSANFIFEMGIIPSLYFVVMKCRHPTIRRKAASLLSTTIPRKEGFWDADLMQATSERIIAVEEDGIDQTQFSDLTDLSTFIPEERRVHELAIHHRVGGPDMPRTQKVTLMMKSHGLDGPWNVWEEELVWVNGKARWSECDWTMPMDQEGRDMWALRQNGDVWFDQRASVTSMFGFDDLPSLSKIIRSWNI